MRKIFVDCFLDSNLGDDLFLLTLINRYKEIEFKIFADKDYSEAFAKISNLKVINKDKCIGFLKFFNGLKRFAIREKIIYNADAMVTIAGSIFMENNQRGFKYNILKFIRFFKDYFYALMSKRYFIISSNFGPYHTNYYYNFYKTFFKSRCFDVCFRDIYSYSLFNDLKNVRYAPDALFTVNIPKLEKRKQVFFSVVNLSNKNKFSSIVYQQESYERWILNSIREANRSGYNIILSSFSSQEEDDFAVERLANEAEKLGIKTEKLFYLNHNVESILTSIAQSEIVVGTRFHATILGLVAGARVLPIMYSEKTKHALEDIHFDMSKTIDLKTVTAEGLDSLDPVRDAVKFDVTDVVDKAGQQFAALDAFCGKV